MAMDPHLPAPIFGLSFGLIFKIAEIWTERGVLCNTSYLPLFLFPSPMLLLLKQLDFYLCLGQGQGRGWVVHGVELKDQMHPDHLKSLM